MNRKKNLLIISDTKMQKMDGKVFAFNSVVLELEVFKKLFDNITWIGFDYNDLTFDNSLLEVRDSNIKLVMMPRSGGRNIFSKLKIFLNFPLYSLIIIRHIQKFDVIHSRGPSGPMFISLMFSFFYRKKNWIMKYANNWSDENAPFFWKIQKRMMIHQNWIIGTVNGQWPDMPNHLKKFENPCIHEKNFDLQLLDKFRQEKKRLLFVGRIEFEKGIKTFLDAINKLDENKIDEITIIGVGKDLAYLMNFLENYKGNVNIEYLGSQSKEIVNQKMKESHFLVLPTTASEGFPKVIAEAWGEGCLPIASNISSIGQYIIHDENGFIWEYLKNENFADVLSVALSNSDFQLQEYAKNGLKICDKFTYKHYEKKLRLILDL
jgi:glycosyltransferase involved in cell wall biosynthesis